MAAGKRTTAIYSSLLRLLPIPFLFFLEPEEASPRSCWLHSGFNFIVEDLTWENGPIRQIRGTHLNVQDPPSPADEP